MLKTPLRRLAAPLALATAFAGGLAVQAIADQPYMRQALDGLGAARAALVAAVPDKGGHRIRAIHLIDDAIAEVHRGIGYAQ